MTARQLRASQDNPGLLMLAMIAKRRSLSSWLAGLFLIAQIAGVIPLMSGHTAHVAAAELTLSSGTDGSMRSPIGHHHGDADGFVQHHELQDLSGAIPCQMMMAEFTFVVVAMTGDAPCALAENQPVLLERPPKPVLFV